MASLETPHTPPDPTTSSQAQWSATITPVSIPADQPRSLQSERQWPAPTSPAPISWPDEPGSAKSPSLWPATASPAQDTPGEPSFAATIRFSQTDDVFTDDSTPRQAEIPLNPTNESYVTQAYKEALINRFSADSIKWDLRPEEKEDKLPIFLYDILTLPGSLAAKFGHLYTEGVTNNLTPAVLPGYHAHVHATTHGPCVVRSTVPGDHIQGMLLFDAAKAERVLLREHYIPNCLRRKVHVEFEVAVFVPEDERSPGEIHNDTGHRVERRDIWAFTYVERDINERDYLPRWRCPVGWNIADYLRGEWLTFNQRLPVINDEKMGPSYDPDGEDEKELAKTRDVAKGVQGEGFRW